MTLVRNRTVEKVDSIGLVVRRWTQCSSGEVEESEQRVEFAGDLVGGLLELGVGLGEDLHRLECLGA